MQKPEIQGYRVDGLIQSGAYSEIYSATRIQDNALVVLKHFRGETREARHAQLLECDLTEQLKANGKVSCLGVKIIDDHPVLILKKAPGTDLKRLMKNGHYLSAQQTLALMIQLTHTLEEIHRAGYIHQNLEAGNILYDRDSQQVTLIDFGNASPIERRESHRECVNPYYMAPEQTERLARNPDQRTDFYQLGVLLYYLLGYQLPFEDDDLSVLVHHHLATSAIPLHRRFPGIPVVLSSLVEKLMSKDPELRYQSNYGLRKDLSRCLERLEEAYDIEFFPLGTDDVPEMMHHPRRFYGKQREQRFVLKLLEDIYPLDEASRSDEDIDNSFKGPHLLLIRGGPGMGKTTLAQELSQPINEREGYFALGKCDINLRNTPYSGFEAALTNLTRQWLLEPQTSQDQIKHRLCTHLMDHGPILIETFPSLSSFLGGSKPLPQLGPTESAHRLYFAVRALFQAILHFNPFVLVLDDLHWADTATLNLTRKLLSDETLPAMLIVGTYRGLEVDSNHPLQLTLDRLKSEGIHYQTLTVKPLASRYLAQLVHDIFYWEPEPCQELAEWLFEQSGGNPFFAFTLLDSLHQKGLLWFDPAQREWKWTRTSIDLDKNYLDVSQLLKEKMHALPCSTQELLMLASALGTHFDLAHLALAWRQEPRTTLAELWPAVTECLLSPLDTCYRVLEEAQAPRGLFRFPHDHIRSAAYDLIPDGEHRQTHAKIGVALLEGLDEEARRQHFFTIVDHLNQGQTLDNHTRAQLNLEAGQRAKEATSLYSARQYLEQSIALLPAETRWQQDNRLTSALYREMAEVAYLSGHMQQAEEYSSILQTHSTNLLENVGVFRLKVISHTMTGHLENALQAGLKALALLGHFIPEQDLEPIVAQEYAAVLTLLDGQNIEDILQEEANEDPNDVAILDLMVETGAPAFMAYPMLWRLLVLRAISLCLEKGPTPAAIYAYSCMGLILLKDEKPDYQRALQLGEIAFKLGDRFENSNQACKAALLLGNTLLHWQRHINKAPAILARGYRSALLEGNPQYASYITVAQINSMYFQGKPLKEVRVQLSNALAFVRRTGNQIALQILDAMTLHLSQLERNTHFVPNPKDEAAYLAQWREMGNLAPVGQYYILRAEVMIMHGFYQDALLACKAAEPTQDYMAHAMLVNLLPFYKTMAIAGGLKAATAEELNEVAEQVAYFQKLAEACPDNYAHMHFLMMAEQARLVGDLWAAGTYFEKAVDTAEEQGFTHHQGLAHDRAALFWESQQMQRQADMHRKGAHHCFREWGAHLLSGLEMQSNDFSASYKLGDTQILEKISHLLKIQVGHPKETVEKMLPTLISFAGAQRGVFLLGTAHNWEIISPESFCADETDIFLEPDLPISVIQWVLEGKGDVILNDARASGEFGKDPYFLAASSRSVLACAIPGQERPQGLLFLENNFLTHAFTLSCQKTLQGILSHLSLLFENHKMGKELLARREVEQKNLTHCIDTEKAFREVMGHLEGLVFIRDHHRRLLHVNATLEQKLGLDSKQWLGKTMCELLPNDNITAYVERALQPDYDDSNKQWLEFHCKDGQTNYLGTLFPIEREGRPPLEGGIFLDITLMREKRDALRASHNQLAVEVNRQTQQLQETNRVLTSVLNHIPHAVFWKDSNLVYLGANRNFARDMGFQKPEDLVGKSDTDLPFPQDLIRERLEEDLRVIQQGMPILNREEMLQAPDGKRELLLSKVPLEDAYGNTGMLGIYVDITYLKEQEHRLMVSNQEILKNQERLIAQEKMASLGILSAGIVHDIRNPLTFVENMAEVTQSLIEELREELGQNLPGDVEEILGDISNNLAVIFKHGRRATTITNNVMQLARGKEAGTSLVDIDDLVKEHVSFSKGHRGPEDLIIEQRYGKLGKLKVQPGELGRVIVNLINNAIDALARAKGERPSLVPRILVTTELKEKTMEIVIRDNGPGIATKHLSDIFRPFFTTKPTGKGNVGLGLAMCHDIITSGHQGKLLVDTKIGEYTCFTIVLPRDPGPQIAN